MVTGTKAWITHAGGADFYNVFCRTGGPGPRGISCLFAPAGTPGILPQTPERTMGLRSSPVAQIVVRRARIPDGQLIGAEGGGFGIAMGALDTGRLGIAACAVGLAQARAGLRRRVRPRARAVRPGDHRLPGAGLPARRRGHPDRGGPGADPRGRPAQGRRPPVQHRGGQGQAVRHRHGDAGDHRRGAGTGGYGYVADHPVERYMREAKVLQIVEGTNQIQRLVIARSLRKG